jgi:hypothetical protein
MGFMIKIKDSVVVDGTDFVRNYYDNKPNFNFDNVGNFLTPRLVDQDYLEYSGYNLNVKSNIYRDAISTKIIDCYRKITAPDTNSSIILGYLEMELVYYERS